MKFVKNEDAVSPVIGVILMVAITVISCLRHYLNQIRSVCIFL